MKDARGKTIYIGDTVLVPLPGEAGYDEQICTLHTLVAALQTPDGTLVPFVEENCLLKD